MRVKTLARNFSGAQASVLENMTGKKPGWRAARRVDGDGDAKGKMGNETGDRAGTGVRNETGCLPGAGWE